MSLCGLIANIFVHSKLYSNQSELKILMGMYILQFITPEYQHLTPKEKAAWAKQHSPPPHTVHFSFFYSKPNFVVLSEWTATFWVSVVSLAALQHRQYKLHLTFFVTFIQQHTHSFIEPCIHSYGKFWIFSQPKTCLLGNGRMPEYSKETHADKATTCKLNTENHKIQAQNLLVLRWKSQLLFSLYHASIMHFLICWLATPLLYIMSIHRELTCIPSWGWRRSFPEHPQSWRCDQHPSGQILHCIPDRQGCE